jgi:hypothetical protein
MEDSCAASETNEPRSRQKIDTNLEAHFGRSNRSDCLFQITVFRAIGRRLAVIRFLVRMSAINGIARNGSHA